MKTLIIAEKPDMGRTIAAVVERGARNQRTHLEGEKYIVTWAIGHLVSLCEPDQYDPRYKKWQAQDLPIIPEQFKLMPNPKTSSQLKVIKELAKRCDRIVNACDAGREGQLIFHYIKRYLGLRLPTERLWISDLTPETIRKGFDNLKNDNEYDALTDAATARSEADWLIGMNASRAFTIKHRTLLSVGRVQTPVLALLYDRHQEISAFQSDTYYMVYGSFAQQAFTYRGTWQGERITSREQADKLVQKVAGKPAVIKDYTVAQTKEHPFRLHDLTLLQREANGRFGFSAKKTLDLAQGLYEKHKVISYPRTNSNYVTEENIPIMHKVLQMLKGTSYQNLANGATPSLVHKGNRAICNPSKVEDHHAIMPTPKKASGLAPDEQKIYDLIVRRFLSHFYPPALYKSHTVLTEVAEEIFRTKAKELIDLGWKVVLEGNEEQDANNSSDKATKQRRKKQEAESDEDEQLLTQPFVLDANQSVHCVEAEVQEKMTQPPKPFTEGTLLRAMESAGKAIEDEQLREAMKDTGLGTPATRAATIERLKQVGYITLTGKRLAITAKGLAAIQLIRGAGVELLASPEMTGRWEQRLYQISRGEAQAAPFMQRVRQFAAMVVDKVSQQAPAPASLFGEEVAAGAAKGSSRNSRSTKGANDRSKSVASGTSTGSAAGAASRKERVVKAKTSLTEEQIPCPRTGCTGSLIEGKRGYGCSSYRSGCGFVIWKQQLGKNISAAMAKQLVQQGHTATLAFKQKDGSSYKAKLVLIDRDSGKLDIRLE